MRQPVSQLAQPVSAQSANTLSSDGGRCRSWLVQPRSAARALPHRIPGAAQSHLFAWDKHWRVVPLSSDTRHTQGAQRKKCFGILIKICQHFECGDPPNKLDHSPLGNGQAYSGDGHIKVTFSLKRPC